MNNTVSSLSRLSSHSTLNLEWAVESRPPSLYQANEGLGNPLAAQLSLMVEPFSTSECLGL